MPGRKYRVLLLRDFALRSGTLSHCGGQLQ
jgi:hypothetical protein